MPTGLKIVAIAQAWGAATGTWSGFRLLSTTVRNSEPFLTVLLSIFVLAFYTISGAGALLMLRGSRTGIRMVRFAQIPQLVYVQAPDFIYMLLSGLYAGVYATTGGAGINVGVMSTFTVRWGQIGLKPGIGINVLAFAVLLYLYKRDPFRSALSRHYPALPESELDRWSGPP